MRRAFVALAVATTAVIAPACSGSHQPTVGTGPVDGETLFAQPTLGGRQGCPACHSITTEVVIGPPLAGVGARAAQRVPGLSASEYLRQSILEPSAYVVEGYDTTEMPSGWDDILSPEQIKGLVEYLGGL